MFRTEKDFRDCLKALNKFKEGSSDDPDADYQPTEAEKEALKEAVEKASLLLKADK